MKRPEDVRTLTETLIRQASVTPDDADCQILLAKQLAGADFVLEPMHAHGITNLWATHGNGSPTLVLAGHTDVVPPGPLSAWSSPPFEPSVRKGCLYGRGSADMKGSLAAMTLAAIDYVTQNPEHAGRLALLITSDEEGPALHGTRHVIEQLMAREEQIDYCIVGEPSSTRVLGDVIRTGRRGSLNGYLTVHGIQGHVAYADLARNPIHALSPALAELAATKWDEGIDPFPATTFQVSNLHAGTGAENVIPGTLEMAFNFRYSPASLPDTLKDRTEQILRRHDVDFSLDWRLSGEPFHTPRGTLIDAVDAALLDHCGKKPEHSTGGGTSDGRFIAMTGAEIVELGPVNATIHKADECVRIADLEALREIYLDVIRRLLN